MFPLPLILLMLSFVQENIENTARSKIEVNDSDAFILKKFYGCSAYYHRSQVLSFVMQKSKLNSIAQHGYKPQLIFVANFLSAEVEKFIAGVLLIGKVS